MRIRALALAAAAALVFAAPADAQPIRRRPPLGPAGERAQTVLDVLGPEHLLREAWRVTRQRFYDGSLNGVDWDAVLERYQPQASGVKTPAELYELINEMLGELKTSHLALIDHAVWARELAEEFRGRPSLRAGCELVEIEGRAFAAGVVNGGAAELAGLRDGDEVVTIDGVPALESPLLIGAGHDPGMPGPPGYILSVTKGEDIDLAVRRSEGGPLEECSLTPKKDSLINATRRSVRVVERGSAKVGVIHLWHFMHREIFQIARQAIDTTFKDADVLVLDLRGRGGSSMVVSAILGLFSGRRARWKKPVLCLTDGHTRSAKEIFAFHWKLRDLGPVVGETTQGACIGCTFQQLSDGSVLMVPVQDVRRLTRGEVLEGVGVAPTIEAASLPLPYRAGRDPILERGLEEARRLVRRVAVPF